MNDFILHVTKHNIYGVIITLALIFLFYWMYLLGLKRKFSRIYAVSLPQKVWVHKSHKKKSSNYYELFFPEWRCSKKDGTRDKRYNDNPIIYYKSILWFENYKIKTKNPIYMIRVVNSLRASGNEIDKIDIEECKYRDCYNTKILQKKLNSIDNIIQAFLNNPYGFEEYCAELFEKMGIMATQTAITNDGGYDLVLEYPNKETGIVECKCYNQFHSVSRPAVQKLVGANQVVNADKMVFITTSKFSAGAIEYAEKCNVELIDGMALVELVKKYIIPENIVVEVNLNEWKLNIDDIKPYVAKDILPFIK